MGKKQLKKAYYFMKWERCHDCRAFYMDNASKVVNKNRPIKKNKQPKPLQAKYYVSYINSKRWHKRRRAYYARYGNECTICGSKEQVNLHHNTYVRLGCELDEDLVPLCGIHHDDYHQMYGTSKDMVKTTDEFIAYMKQEAFEREQWATLIH